MLLQRAVDAAAHLGPDALPVRSRLLAAQGRLARTTGRIPESREYFKKALALCSQPDKTTGDLALASISMGEAMLEAGRKDEARELFLKGLSGSENASYLLNDCLNALRGLARISTAVSYTHLVPPLPEWKKPENRRHACPAPPG